MLLGKSGHFLVTLDAVASSRFGSHDRSVRLIRSIGQSGEGHYIWKTVGAGGLDCGGEGLEAFGVMTLVVHTADESVGLGGGADQSGAFEERPVFDGQKLHAGGSEIFGVLDKICGAPSGSGKEGPGGNDLFDLGSVGGEGRGSGQGRSTQKAEKPAAPRGGEVFGGSWRREIHRSSLVIQKCEHRGKLGTIFSGPGLFET